MNIVYSENNETKIHNTATLGAVHRSNLIALKVHIILTSTLSASVILKLIKSDYNLLK